MGPGSGVSVFVPVSTPGREDSIGAAVGSPGVLPTATAAVAGRARGAGAAASGGRASAPPRTGKGGVHAGG